MDYIRLAVSLPQIVLTPAPLTSSDCAEIVPLIALPSAAKVSARVSLWVPSSDASGPGGARIHNRKG